MYNDEFQKILREEVGSKLEYEQECGNKPLGVFVCEITGLDMNAAKEAFADIFDTKQFFELI